MTGVCPGMAAAAPWGCEPTGGSPLGTSLGGISRGPKVLHGKASAVIVGVPKKQNMS